MLSKRIANYTTKPAEEIEFSEETIYSHVGDRLVAVNDQVLIYDEYGRLTDYNGKNFSWQRNRLARIGNIEIAYDTFGRRVQKGATTFTYDSSNNLLTAGALSFFYDTHGVAGFVYEGATYYYRKNIQGDVIALLDSSGKVVATYLYDAWGNCVVATDTNGIGEINPIRYRGYYWDAEFSLYYLQSRYYSPELCRFISQDSIEYLDPESINGLNLYAYCKNNPIMYADPTGHMPEWLKWVLAGVAIVAAIALTVVTMGAATAITVGVGIAIGGAYGAVSAKANGQDIFTGFLIGAVVGGVTGLVSEMGAVIMFAGSFLAGAGGDIASQRFLEKKSWDDINLVSSLFAGIANAGLTYIGKSFSFVLDSANLSNFHNIIGNSIIGGHLSGFGMGVNLIISQHSWSYTIGDLKHDFKSIWRKTANG